MTTSGGIQETVAGAPGGANVLVGFQTFAATTAATNVIQVPAGKTWTGWVSVNCSCAEAAAGAVQGQATAVLSIAGAGANPPAGNIGRCSAYAGANAATGLVGSDGNNSMQMPLTIVAPAANAVQLQVTTTQAGTTSEVNVTASGLLA